MFAAEYRQAICALLEQIETTQMDAVRRGAEILAKAVAEGRLIHVIGPGGHSNMAVEEVFWRAGGLVPVNAILDAGTNLIHGAKRTNIIERTPGYARAVFDAYRLERGDALVIVNAYGINAMTIDSALLCSERGITSIGITSTSFAHLVPKDAASRHPSGQNLYELVDVFIDNHLPAGDSIMALPGVPEKMGATSTFVNCFTINLLMMQTAVSLAAMGVEPKIWMSANMPDGDLRNKQFEKDYMPRIRHL